MILDYKLKHYLKNYHLANNKLKMDNIIIKCLNLFKMKFKSN